MLSGAGAGAFGKTCGVSIGRIAPDSGRGVGIAGWRGSVCALGRDAGGAANNDGVTGSGLGTAGAIGWTGGVVTAAGGNREGVGETTFDGCEAADEGVTAVGADACIGDVVGRGTLSLAALAAIGDCDGAGAAGAGVTGFGS